MDALAASVVPFEQLVVEFLAYLEFERGLSRNTLDAYRSDLLQLGRHLRRHGKPAQLAEAGDLAAFLAALADGDVDRPPVAPATLQRKAACLRSFYRHLRRAELVAEDPTGDLRGPPTPARPPRVLNRTELARLLDGPRGRDPGPLRDRALLEAMCATGLRASETIALKVADVDRQGGMLRIRGRRTEERFVPIEQRALLALGAYLDYGRAALIGSRPEPHLFLNRRGGRLTRQGLYKIVARYAENAGLAGRMSPSTLRHTFAAHALAGGRDVRSLQGILGHADRATTELYAHVSLARVEVPPA